MSEKPTSIVAEPNSIYNFGSTPDAETETTPNLYHMLGLTEADSRPLSITKIRKMIEHGFEKVAFENLKEATSLTSKQLCSIVRIPYRTLARREKFKPEESERILRLATVFHKGIEVLGSQQLARRWFTSPKRALDGEAPFSFCDTEIGADEVENLLGRIEHGVFS